MFQIYIWGAGFYAKQVLGEIDDSKAEVLGIIDSDRKKQGTKLFDTIPVLCPSDISGRRFDYLIISVRNYGPVEEACIESGIPSEKIIVYWKESPDNSVFKKRAERVEGLIWEKQVCQYRLDSAPYEWSLKASPKIWEGTELLKKIAKDHSSLCRFGDGEFEMIRGKVRPWFQKPDITLGERLKEVLCSDDVRINIAIPQNFCGFDKYKEDAADNIRRYMFGNTRKDILALLDKDRLYYDAYVSRPYMMYKDGKNADEIFPLFQKLWKDRDVLIIEGEYSRIGIGNDLMAKARSVSRILCPFKNAWDKYENILNTVLEKANREALICISLGPCATVLAYDLAKRGYQALDIGQIDNEYDWYMQGAKVREDIPGKLVAERPAGQNLELDEEIDYQKQIIARIRGN
ncbi:MAG: DUF1792 domain-containing protein [Dorea sp.]|nr:DUF1792 domain-containing protein [Dorea sp.]